MLQIPVAVIAGIETGISDSKSGVLVETVLVVYEIFSVFSLACLKIWS